MFDCFLETLSFAVRDVVYNFTCIYICLVRYFDIVDIIDIFFLISICRFFQYRNSLSKWLTFDCLVHLSM